MQANQYVQVIEEKGERLDVLKRQHGEWDILITKNCLKYQNHLLKVVMEIILKI